MCGVGAESISLPNELRSIGSNGFIGSNIRTITISDSVEGLNRATFAMCYNLEEMCMLYVGNKSIDKIFYSTGAPEENIANIIDIYVFATAAEWRNVTKVNGWDDGVGGINMIYNYLIEP